jgi:hypothetical protein
MKNREAVTGVHPRHWRKLVDDARCEQHESARPSAFRLRVIPGIPPCWFRQTCHGNPPELDAIGRKLPASDGVEAARRNAVPGQVAVERP